MCLMVILTGGKICQTKRFQRLKRIAADIVKNTVPKFTALVCCKDLRNDNVGNL